MQIFDTLHDEQLIAAIRSGAVGVIPTDTVYGLVSAANNKVAVTRLYALKDREQKPGTIIAANVEQILELGITPTYLKLIDKFWPGPVSVETPHDIAYLHQGTGRQAIRIPGDEQLRAFLERTGPLQTTSANLPGVAPANTVSEARASFGDTIDYYVDGGDTAGSEPSTIIRIFDNGIIEIIRQGAGKIA